ncbi:hypothetical protein AVEN_189868-1 [Araneus ventricosus]|uniref:Uncharacterized protein n=1 Tax=Araneus ventricosus TaxID=182803 RepID=A0A4Y2EGV2_ARAVE|nr:hypothetical protein AVEN_189868-1 [Araneus ventricosus]
MLLLEFWSLRYGSQARWFSPSRNNAAFPEDMGSSHAIGRRRTHFISLSHTPVTNGLTPRPQTKCWPSVGKRVRSIVQIRYRLHSSHLP